MSFDIIHKRGGGGLRRLVTAKAMPLRVERLEPDALLHVPHTQMFQGLEEVV